MQYAKIVFQALLTVSLFANMACSEDKTGDKKKKATSENPTAGVGESRSPVCYLIGCYDPVSTEGLEKTYPDYIYPDPSDFNDAKLRYLYSKPVGILDLRHINLDGKISENFLVQDFMSVSKGRYGLFSSHVVTQMQLMRNFVQKPIFVTSGYRSPGYNRRTDGSASWSRHTYGDAVDFQVSGKKISELTSLCEKYGASFTLTYSTHIHCDWRETPGDLAFYDKRISTDTDLNIADMVASKSEIRVTELNDSRLLSVFLALPEDDEMHEGDLTYYWFVAWPDGRSFEANSPEIQLPRNTGPVSVVVRVGGSIAIERHFQW